MRKIKFLVVVSLMMLFVAGSHYGVSANVVSGNFEYSELSDGTICIIDYYTSTDKTMIVPSEIDGKKVSEINPHAFYHSQTIEHIIIQEGITTIYTQSFRELPKLKSILIPNSVNSIDEISPDWVVIVPPVPFRSSRIIIYTNPDSYAKNYLKAMGWPLIRCIKHQNIINIATGTKCADCGAIISEFVPSTISINYQKGSKISSSNFIYKVTNTKNRTVEFSNITSSKKSLIIPATVKVGNKVYKVTSVAKNALKNNKKLKKVIIGNNIKKINTNAFKGCKNLKTITIKSKSIKTIGKNAFKGINVKAKIRVPASKLKKYKKLFMKKGLKSTVKIVKI